MKYQNVSRKYKIDGKFILRGEYVNLDRELTHREKCYFKPLEKMPEKKAEPEMPSEEQDSSKPELKPREKVEAEDLPDKEDESVPKEELKKEGD